MVALSVYLLAGTPGNVLTQDFAAAIYGGQLTSEKWERARSPRAEFADTTIVLAAASWTRATGLSICPSSDFAGTGFSRNFLSRRYACPQSG